MRASAGRVVLPVLALLGLAALVAIAAGGRTPSGTDASRPVPDVLFDSIISVGIVLLLPAAVIVVYGLLQRKAIRAEIQRRRYPRFGLAGWVTFALLFALLTWYRGRDWQRPTIDDELGEQAFPGGGAPTTGSQDAATSYEPEFAWIPVAAIALLAALAVAAFLLSTRRRGAAVEEPLAATVAEIIDDTLDDLRAERNARRAVIAAFARLERALAASGVPRGRAETAHEYVRRALATLEVREAPAARLAGLFEVARFSDHVVGAEMKEEAIGALEEVRDDLRRSRPHDETATPVEASAA
ncbi:MAG: hypothetical protein KatS3mg012_2014 [Gaiellaceae bacterium]|nr:MAG: hypothetical protein KatS3mg012_2014 [Gaiellaceae bacterium]